MSEIKLKRLALKNFKGIKNLAVDFEQVTNIYGENKLGKTTVFDGFTWLLFDKDCKDRISKIIDEPLFKLISNPLYFSLNIKWQDGRKVILDIIGDISKEKVINQNPDLNPLLMSILF